MVLKRKIGDDFVPVHGEEQPLPMMSEQESGATKKLRVNPPRSARMAETPMSVPSTAVLPKKTRAPRKKKVPDPVDSTPDPGSSMPQAGPSQPSAPAKRGRKKKTTDDDGQSEPEKRKAQFKPRCPQNILDRVERVMTQRFFMIERQRNGDELREIFSVLGSTGNVYTVTIDHLPRCNCPDTIKGNHCKHILFVFLKVLGVSRESGFWYQKALLTTELEQIFREAPLAPTVHANTRIREAYAQATGKVVEGSTDNTGKKRMPSEEDDCPVCYDGMHGMAESSLVFCEECGNALHKECFAEWRKTSQNKGKELTCVYCRASWVIPGPSGATVASKARGGYVNLAAIAGSSPVRDTSTYYHGPRRGERNYGYNNYND